MFVILWAFFTFNGVQNLPYPVQVFESRADCEQAMELVKYQYKTQEDPRIQLACLSFAQI